MFDSAARELIKKHLFSQMLCLGGLGLCFWMSVEVSFPARKPSNHYLTAEAPPCCCEARPVAAGSCCSAAFSTMGYDLQRSLFVVAGVRSKNTKSIGNKSKNRQMGPNETAQLLHGKGNSH